MSQIIPMLSGCPGLMELSMGNIIQYKEGKIIAFHALGMKFLHIYLRMQNSQNTD